MEELDFGSILDEAAVARVAHAEFLEKVKKWGTETGMVCSPFAHIGETIMESDMEPSDDDTQAIIFALPMGIKLLIQQLNELYELLQTEAVQVLGAPFEIHEAHLPMCGEEGVECPHQDHYKPSTDE